ncbi:MAG: YcaO-like family protein [Candidatus Saccharibacteria bacterium]
MKLTSPDYDIVLSAEAGRAMEQLQSDKLVDIAGLEQLQKLGIIVENFSSTQALLARLDTYLSETEFNARLLKKGSSRVEAELSGYGYKMGASYGWDTDSNIAKLKAVVENYERVSSEFVVNEHLLTKAGAKCWSAELYEFKDWQYNLPGFPYTKKPSGLWLNARNPATGCEVSVPAELTLFSSPMNGCGPSSSSGVAAHPNYEEAVIRSAYEVCERDALMSHWYREVPPTQVNPPMELTDRIRRLEHLELEVSFFWLQLGLVPVAMTILRSQSYSYPRCVIGLGAAPKLSQALNKAFEEVEVNSTYLGSEVPTPKSATDISSVMDHQYWYNQDINAEPLAFMWHGPYNNLASVPDGPATIETINHMLANHGLSWAVVKLNPTGTDQTGIYVVRSFIRGLTPIGFGYQSEPLGSPRLSSKISGDKHSLRVTKEGYLPQPFA